MATFSATDAAFEGFRLTREHPRAVLIWAGLSLIGTVAATLFLESLSPATREAMDALRSNQAPDLQSFASALPALGPLLLISLVTQSMIAAGVYRVTLNPADHTFGYLRLGRDEMRLIGLTFLVLALFIALVFAVTLATGIAVATTLYIHQSVGLFVAAVIQPFALGVLLYILLRLSLSAASTFVNEQISLKESWRMTKGHLWKLLGAYILALVCMVVVAILAMIVFYALASVIVLIGGGAIADVAAALQPSKPGIAGLLRLGPLAYMLFTAIVMAVYYAVVIAPSAVIYRTLREQEHDLAAG